MTLRLIGLLMLSCLLFSCKNNSKTADMKVVKYDSVQYSSSFGIASYSNFKQLFYCNNNDTVWSLRSDEIKHENLRIVVLSSVFAGFIEALNQRHCIVGVDKMAYFSDSVLLSQYKRGEIVEVGEEGQLNLELLMSLKADILIGSQFTYSDKALVKRLESNGTKVLYCDNFKEQDPLARAEWIKFFGFITHASKKADSVFNIVSSNYSKIKSAHSNKQDKPIVFTDALYQDAWNIPGGNSYTARMINDAGGTYVFADKNDFYTYPLSLETVFNAAANADIWIHVNQFKSREDMLKSEKRYGLFQAFQNKLVFNYNKRENQFGGNDFWETGVYRPDLVLLDLTRIFSLDKNNFHSLYFYTWLN